MPPRQGRGRDRGRQTGQQRFPASASSHSIIFLNSPIPAPTPPSAADRLSRMTSAATRLRRPLPALPTRPEHATLPSGLWGGMTFFSFYGRSNRMDLWLLVFALGLAQFAALVIFQMVITPLMLSTRSAAVQGGVGMAVGLFILLAPLWPITAAAVRRSHDLNLSGWWYAALVLISGSLDTWARSPMHQLTLAGGEPLELRNILSTGSWVIGLFVVLVLGFMPGRSADNRFGPGSHSRHRNYRAAIAAAPDAPVIREDPAAPD